jgi:thiosulfate/3-mercaptopyruvate sulfurtransferase
VAGRLVWMLRIIGQPAALLDGGFTSWTGDIETGRGARPIPVSRSVVEWPTDAMASADEVAAAIEAGVVVADGRAGDRYRGEIEPIDAKAGHVPGAISLPFSVNLDQGRFRPVDELRRRFDEAGIDGDGIVYCGSGVSACNNLLAIEAAGLGRPRLYVGSWSGWSSDPDRPVATTEQ